MEINVVKIQMAPKVLTDRNFDAELVAPGRIVLVIFYDENFSNRYLIEPGLVKLDEQYSQRVKFCRINTRENPKTAERFRIITSPTILFFYLKFAPNLACNEKGTATKGDLKV